MLTRVVAGVEDSLLLGTGGAVIDSSTELLGLSASASGAGATCTGIGGGFARGVEELLLLR